jgi:8-oxo-dGTP pyrophosphatase MutT (NUDIX family)
MERQYRYPHGRVFFEIPAGKLDSPDEDPKDAAVRELKEETNAEVEIIPGFRREMEYVISSKKNVSKEVIYFLGKCTYDHIIPQRKEISEARFVPYREAAEMITFEDSRRILEDAEDMIRRP